VVCDDAALPFRLPFNPLAKDRCFFGCGLDCGLIFTNGAPRGSRCEEKLVMASARSLGTIQEHAATIQDHVVVDFLAHTLSLDSDDDGSVGFRWHRSCASAYKRMKSDAVIKRDPLSGLPDPADFATRATKSAVAPSSEKTASSGGSFIRVIQDSMGDRIIETCNHKKCVKIHLRAVEPNWTVTYPCGTSQCDLYPEFMSDDPENQEFEICITCGKIQISGLDLTKLRAKFLEVEGRPEEETDTLPGEGRGKQQKIATWCEKCKSVIPLEGFEHKQVALYKCSMCGLVCDKCCNQCEAADHEIQLD